MSVITMKKGQIVLPRRIRRALGLQEGDRFRLTIEGDRLVFTPLSEEQDWQRWRGRLAGTQALQEHMAEHADEVAHERLP